MLLPEELISRSAIPALRAAVAKKLIFEYGLTQVQVAKLLNLTQPAVSNYIRGSRGRIIDLNKIEELDDITSEIADLLVRGEDASKVIALFSKAVAIIRKKGILCDIHKKFESEVNLSSCDVCKE